MAMKKLRVCKSNELPDVLQRSSDYLYFVYDKLVLYSGTQMMSDNFAIAPSMPSDPVVGMIYILDSDGSVHRYTNYQDVKIATIENTSQIPILKKAGTMYYINSAHRYLDMQRRTLTLPWNNGKYELNVNMKNNQIFDNNTILKYNTKSERFEVYGPQDEEFIDFSKPFRGKGSESVDVIVDGPRISANIKISKFINNILAAAPDGLYVLSDKFVKKATFNEWSMWVTDLANYCKDILDLVESELAGVQQIVSKESIDAEIMKQLRAKYSTIDTAIAQYNVLANEVSSIETALMNYAAQEIEKTRIELSGDVYENGHWHDILEDDDPLSFKQEIDYYNIAEDYLYPDRELSPELVAALCEIAVESYILAESEES